jgi:hypothetical protein
MDEEDLKAYIGSDSSDAESISSKISSAENRKAKKRDAQREKMRAALGLAIEPSTKSSSKKKDPAEPIGDMQITFTSGLGGGKEGKSVFENEPQDEESTRARYIRKERERKQRRKEKSKTSNGTAAADEPVSADDKDAEEKEDDPFNDPFFNDPGAATKAASSAAKKASKQRALAESTAKASETAHRAAELDLLMASENAATAGDDLRHFDMREIKKAEKDAKRSKINKKYNKKKAAAAAAGEEAVRDDFKVETEDPRFKKLFESHEFAIDPSDRLFAGTRAMKEAVEEGRRKRRAGDGEEGEEREGERERKGGKKARKTRV